MKLSVRCLFVVVCTLFLAVGSVRSNDEKRAMTPRDLARIQSMKSAVISPDGALIAAVKSVPRELFEETDGEAWQELYLIDRETGDARAFVTGEVNVSAVAWRPDSSAVSFLAERGDDETQKLYLIATDGGEATPILALGTSAISYAWDPLGDRVAVIAPRAKPEEVEELEKLGFDQEVFEEDWQPFQVFIAHLGDGSEPRVLDLPGSAFQVRWSPDGQRLAVAVAPRPLVDDRYMFQTVHIVDLAEGEIVATVEREGKMGRMEWSPDGHLLAMISAADLNDPSATSLLVVPSRGGKPLDLTAGFEGSATGFAWLDSDNLVLLADVGVTTRIYRVAVAGGDLTPIGVGGGGVVYTKMSIADDGRQAALIGESPMHPPEVFTMDLDGGIMPIRLTEANPWLQQIRLAPQETIVHEARDGLELEGLLIRPLEGGTEPAPLVMVVHGGPEAHRRDGWLSRYSAPAQVLAARGYAVFFPNYRGSTGRGVAFQKLGQQDAAGAEFDDLIDAVDHLVEIGVADEERIGVTGGSYGGYATAWLSTRYSERIAAGVMFVGISNKISKFGTTDIPREEVLVHSLHYPWEKWQFYLKRSPLYYAPQCRTPLLIMGGTDDPRVSPTQSNELYRALKILDKSPVRLVRYPGEKHGNRRAASRYDYQLRLLRWFDHYLRGDGGEPPPIQLDYRSVDNGWSDEPGD
jgi:dipeptidyl aminopeptidase/acylaminoacyl peptidase